MPRNVPRSVDASRAVSAQPQQQAPLSMPGADRGQPAPDRDPVEQVVAPVTGSVTQAPRTVVGAVDELIAPKGRGLTSTGSVTGQVAPAAGALLEAVPAAQTQVDGVLSPLQDVVGSLQDVTDPFDDGAQPALTMLPSLPLG